MFKKENLARKFILVAVFLLLGAGVPAVTMLLFADSEYLAVMPSFYCLYIVAYIIHFPLYHKLFQLEERKWWKYLVSLLWLYMALAGVYLFWAILV